MEPNNQNYKTIQRLLQYKQNIQNIGVNTILLYQTLQFYKQNRNQTENNFTKKQTVINESSLIQHKFTYTDK
jgi:hypothetical protein